LGELPRYGETKNRQLEFEWENQNTIQETIASCWEGRRKLTGAIITIKPRGGGGGEIQEGL